MKVPFFAMCLVVALTAGGRAEAAAEAAPSTLSPPTPELQPLEPKQDIQKLEAEARRMDPEGRLSSDQLFRLLQEREAQRQGLSVNPAEVILPIVFFASVLTAFVAWLLARARKMHLLHETVRMMVEKGVEVPAALLAPPPHKPSDLRRGVILSTAGLGLTIFLAALPEVEGIWGAGLTIFFIGVGHLIVWRLQTGKGKLSSTLATELQS